CSLVGFRMKTQKPTHPRPKSQGLLLIRSQFFQYRKILQGSYVACYRTAGGNLSQQSTHYLARTRLWERITEPDVVGSRERSNLLNNVTAQLLVQRFRRTVRTFERDKSHDGRSFDFIWSRHHCRLGNCRMRHEC